jgi:hypothetical protein
MSKILEAYFLAGIFVTLLCFACGESSFEFDDWNIIKFVQPQLNNSPPRQCFKHYFRSLHIKLLE